MGFGVYSDKKADQAVENVKKKKAVGSEFFNKLSGIHGSGLHEIRRYTVSLRS